MHYFFDKNCIGLHFGRYFSPTRLVTLPSDDLSVFFGRNKKKLDLSLADELDLRGPLACACTEDEEKLKKLT
jgi:hypothetical protein